MVILAPVGTQHGALRNSTSLIWGAKGWVALLTPILFPSPDCSFTCHYRCRALVRLDCSGPLGTGDENDGTEQALEKDTNVVGSGLCLQGRVPGWGAASVGSAWVGGWPCQAVPHCAV